MFTDDELTEQALAADPDQSVADDAVPFELAPSAYGDLLPAWYMPAPSTGAGTAARRRCNAVVVSIIVASLLGINALGLCITYGTLELAI